MAETPRPTRVLIVDDHPLVREGLAMRISLQPDLEVCGQAATEDEALALVEETEPDLVLVDVRLEKGDGIALVKQVKSRHPRIKMLVLSGFRESLYAERALRAGALGYLNKEESNEKLLDAIRTVLAGERYVSPRIAQRLLGQAVGGSREAKTPIERLSDRELEVFRMIGEGLTGKAIADRLYLSPHTIDTHRENIKRKLGLADGAELTCAALQWLLENG